METSVQTRTDKRKSINLAILSVLISILDSIWQHLTNPSYAKAVVPPLEPHQYITVSKISLRLPHTQRVHLESRARPPCFQNRMCFELTLIVSFLFVYGQCSIRLDSGIDVQRRDEIEFLTRSDFRHLSILD